MTLSLPVGESTTVDIAAEEYWNHRGVFVEADGVYDFHADGHWTDWTVGADPDGFPTSKSPWYAWVLHRLFDKKRRVPSENWFALLASIEERPNGIFRIGRQLLRWKADASGELAFFANDYRKAYWNNKGTVRLTVTRLS